MQDLRAVLFDLGGTLWEYREGLTVEGMLASVAPKAIALLPPEQSARLDPMAMAVAVRQAYLAEEHAAQRGDRSPVPAERCVIDGLASLGIEVDRAASAAILAALHIPETRTTRLLPGAEETLHTLVGAGLRLGIISNRMHAGTLLLDDLAYFGISHLFSSIVASCEVGQMKPHPLLFERALADLGVSAAEAVMVGDDLQADIGGAQGVDMRAVWMRRPPDRPDPAPPGVPAIVRLDQLPPLLLD